MNSKRRGPEMGHEAKKMKSDDSNDSDGVSSTSSVQTTPALPCQPVTDLDDLPQAAREKINYLLQALGDVSPETLYQVNIMDQINAINCDGPSPPRFKYKPPPIDIMVGYELSIFPTFPIYKLSMLISLSASNDADDCVFIGCDRIIAKVILLPYADGYFTVEIESRGRHTPKLDSMVALSYDIRWSSFADLLRRPLLAKELESLVVMHRSTEEIDPRFHENALAVATKLRLRF
ncbi:hypothetical protein FCIRC_2912 [Fusarium circinatum]|uniref:Uncharacterized protein n=1 Tax=Fusarium circinatum TaxID=48490 RepID=A0A8H5X7N8_FUSCI|nr:hypothetical protein FCIRC_2912 [Fusarium circinatum]